MSIRISPDERSIGFSCGATDYLTKPFNVLELTKRIKNLLQQGQDSNPNNAADFSHWTLNSWRLNPQDLTIRTQDEKFIQLTSGEFTILTQLMKAKGYPVNRSVLCELIERKDGAGNPRTIDVLISRIRRKLKSITPSPFEIVTVPEQGYRIHNLIAPTYLTKNLN
jgi:DNA-binding response OmpR family regulator